MELKVYLTKANGTERIENVYNGKIDYVDADVMDSIEKKKNDVEAYLLNVHSDVEYQTYEGIGGAFTEASAVNYFLLPKQEQKRFIESFFDKDKGIGLNFGRVSINSCDFSVDDYTYVREGDETLESFDISHDKGKIIPMVLDAQKYADLKVFASPWSPPKYMKTNDSRIEGGYLKREYYPLWAKYIKKFTEEYKKAGVPIWGITMQNEPRHAQIWESCNYSVQDEAEFLGYIGKELKKTGIKILCYDHCREREYERAKAIFNSKNGKYCDGIANHFYSGEHYGELEAVRKVFPNKLQIASECCIGSNQKGLPTNYMTAHAETYMSDMITCYNGGVNAYVYWNLLLDGENGPFHNRVNRGIYCDAPAYYVKEEKTFIFDLFYYYIGHIGKFVSRGAKVINTSLYVNSLSAVAFKNPDGSVVTVCQNAKDFDQIVYLRVDGYLYKTKIPSHSCMTFVTK